jgi:glycosyltransferase involved in cell wall biosynthesis
VSGSDPALTVLMPVFDGEPYLRASIESVLRQSFSDFELLIVDDGSEDESVEIARSFADPRVRVVVQGRRGLVETLNHGLELVRGAVVARQDADDLSLPDRLDRQMAVLRAEPQLLLLGGQAHVVDPGGRYRRTSILPTEPSTIEWYQLFDNAFVHGSVLFRREVARDRLGGYAHMLGEDFDLWSRIAELGSLRNLREPVVARRVHPRSFQHSLDERGLDLSHRANLSIIGRNVERALGPGAVSKSDLERMASLRNGIRPEEYHGFVALFDRLLSAFGARRPELLTSRDLSRTLAAQYLQMVHALRRRPVVAAQPLARALRRHPGAVARLAAQLAGGRLGIAPPVLAAPRLEA